MTLQADLLRDLPGSRVGCAVVVLEEVDSTNARGLVFAESGAPEGLAVIAEAQTQGRGRLSRTWESPAGLGIYTSVIFRPPLAPAAAGLLTFVAALATAEAVERVTGKRPALTWPNDLIMEGKKLGGILTEMAVEGERVRHAVVGIGVNVNQEASDFPTSVRKQATSLLLATGRSWDRHPLARALYTDLDTWYDRLLREGPAVVLERYRAHCVTLGCKVRVQGGEGTFSGEAVDLDETGALLVRRGRGVVERVVAADVTLRRSTLSRGNDQLISQNRKGNIAKNRTKSGGVS